MTEDTEQQDSVAASEVSSWTLVIIKYRFLLYIINRHYSLLLALSYIYVTKKILM